MAIDAQAYNITVRRGVFEGETLFEARVKELPDLIEYAESHADAYELAVDAIETTAEVMAERGRAMPAPSEPADEYSGRVTLRIARSLHRALAQASEEEGVSLNQHMVNVLTYFSGFAAGRPSADDGAWHLAQPQAVGARPQHLEVVRSREMNDEVAGWA
jgi:predicted HicB family RNase H-like nuclease